MNIALRHKRTNTSDIEIRYATAEDIPALVDVLDTFFHESQWKAYLTYDREKVTRSLEHLIPTHRQPYLLAFEDGKIVGLISWHLYGDFTDAIAVMDETYLAPRYRTTDLGRKLVALALYLAEGEGARIFNFPLASGQKETATYVNMLKKFGGVECGVLVRVMLDKERNDGR